MIMTKSKNIKVMMSERGRPDARTRVRRRAGVVTTQSITMLVVFQFHAAENIRLTDVSDIPDLSVDTSSESL